MLLVGADEVFFWGVVDAEDADFDEATFAWSECVAPDKIVGLFL